MYITETTENVRNLWKQLEAQDDLSKLKFLIYIFGLLNNNQINDKNEANPNLIEDDIIIFNLENIGFPLNAGTMLLQHFMMLYNNITKTNIIIISISRIVSFLNNFNLFFIASNPTHIKNPTIPPTKLSIISSISNTLPI